MTEADVVSTVQRLGGVATRAALLEVCSPDDLAAAVAGGRLVRTARGRYSTHDADAALVTAHSVGGVLSGLSAAQHWGWAVKREPEKLVVTVPRNRSLVREDLDVRRRDLPATAVVDGVVLSRAQTVVDCARTLPFDAALSVADSSLRDLKLTHEEMLAAAHASPRTGRSRAVRVAECADPGAANPFESSVRAVALDVPGLDVVTQGRVDHFGWADLVDHELKIVIECDSWEFHSGEGPFRSDVRRYTNMTCAGWLVVRFVWEDAMSRPDRVGKALRDVIAIRHAQRRT